MVSLSRALRHMSVIDVSGEVKTFYFQCIAIILFAWSIKFTLANVNVNQIDNRRRFFSRMTLERRRSPAPACLPLLSPGPIGQGHFTHHNLSSSCHPFHLSALFSLEYVTYTTRHMVVMPAGRRKHTDRLDHLKKQCAR
jgi:hypothetical protein